MHDTEAYLPSSDTYIEKDLAINDEIDKLRLAATSALLSGAGHAQQGLCGNSLKHSFGELCDCFRLVAGGAVGGC